MLFSEKAFSYFFLCYYVAVAMGWRVFRDFWKREHKKPDKAEKTVQPGHMLLYEDFSVKAFSVRFFWILLQFHEKR
jgi:hypothetical protein